MSKTVIHRDRSFEYDGERYYCLKSGPVGSGDDAYEIVRERDGKAVQDSFDRLSDIRAYVSQSAQNGWPLIDDDNA